MPRAGTDDLVHQAELLAADLYASRILSGARAMSGQLPPSVDEREVEAAAAVVRREIANPRARKAICAALKAASNNIRDVAKVTAAALLPLSLSGVIAVPATPLALAVAAVIVFDTGVAAFCAASEPEK